MVRFCDSRPRPAEVDDAADDGAEDRGPLGSGYDEQDIENLLFGAGGFGDATLSNSAAGAGSASTDAWAGDRDDGSVSWVDDFFWIDATDVAADPAATYHAPPVSLPAPAGGNALGPGADTNPVDVSFAGAWTDDQRQVVADTVEVLNDLVWCDQNTGGAPIGDIHITAELSEEDGTGGVVNRPGHSGSNGNGGQPVSLVLQFGAADVALYQELGIWQDIVYHEVINNIGYGMILDHQESSGDPGAAAPVPAGNGAPPASDDAGAWDMGWGPLDDPAGMNLLFGDIALSETDFMFA